MKFDERQLSHFDARRGAYSVVTDREVVDSQITATGDEAVLLRDYFESRGESILVGKVSADKILAKKIFKVYGTGASIGLNLVYPKPSKPELRLYMSGRAGFKSPPGSVWFVYESISGVLSLGYMSMDEWENLGLGHISVRVKDRKNGMHSGLYEEDGVVYLDVDVSSMRSCWCKKVK